MNLLYLSSEVLMLGNLLLSYWKPSECFLAMAFTKHLMNWRFICRGGRNMFVGLTRGMCWTLSVGHCLLDTVCWTLSVEGTYVFHGSQSCSM
jgi:hypothetical protein